MSAKIIDGKKIAEEVREEAKKAALACEAAARAPGLAVIIVGEDPASKVYVKNKIKACEAVGIRSFVHMLQADVGEKELFSLIEKLNADSAVDGILCQLPLPPHISEAAVTNAILPEKDVDGFHPVNVGRLYTGEDCLRPCTPAGILRLMDREEIPIEGKTAVVVGRSNIVGKPAAALLLSRNATVTVCHSKTQNLKEIVKSADIVVAAVGKAGFLTADMIKPGAVVIDVGINRGADGRLQGDVDFPSVSRIAGAITPVPGGVGPMTIAMLMENTVKACRRNLRLD